MSSTTQSILITSSLAQLRRVHQLIVTSLPPSPHSPALLPPGHVAMVTLCPDDAALPGVEQALSDGHCLPRTSSLCAHTGSCVLQHCRESPPSPPHRHPHTPHHHPHRPITTLTILTHPITTLTTLTHPITTINSKASDFFARS